MAIKRGPVVCQNPLPLALKIVELPRVEGPREDRQQGQHEQHGERDQQVEDVHGNAARRQRASRSELLTTNSELVAMPRPAAQGGNRPASASGTQTRL